jgi:hypothetical protein
LVGGCICNLSGILHGGFFLLGTGTSAQQNHRKHQEVCSVKIAIFHFILFVSKYEKKPFKIGFSKKILFFLPWV